MTHDLWKYCTLKKRKNKTINETNFTRLFTDIREKNIPIIYFTNIEVNSFQANLLKDSKNVTFLTALYRTSGFLLCYSWQNCIKLESISEYIWSENNFANENHRDQKHKSSNENECVCAHGTQTNLERRRAKKKS